MVCSKGNADLEKSVRKTRRWKVLWGKRMCGEPTEVSGTGQKPEEKATDRDVPVNTWINRADRDAIELDDRTAIESAGNRDGRKYPVGPCKRP